MVEQKRKKTRCEKIGEQWAGFRQFCFDSDPIGPDGKRTGKVEVFGRTGKSWIEILIFYIIFYSLLSCWWAGALYLRCMFLPELEAGPLHNDYLRHRGPGLSASPSLKIRFKQNDTDVNEDYVEGVEEFFKTYTTFNDEDMVADLTKCPLVGGCLGGETYIEPVNISNTSVYSLANLGPCVDIDNINDWKAPCVYLRVNKIFDWTPEIESEESEKDADFLRDYKANGGILNEDFNPIYCKGHKDAAKKIETIETFPKAGVRRDLFPFSPEEDYRGPVVAVRIQPNEQGIGEELRIVCSILADNIYQHHEKINIGRVWFKLTIN